MSKPATIAIALALTLPFVATAAWGFDATAQIVAVPQLEFPDVMVIGSGWPSNMTDGCLDRHSCEAPKAGDKLEVVSQRPTGPASDIPTRPLSISTTK